MIRIMWLGIDTFHQVEGQQITSGEGFDAARSNLWVCWCNAFEQQRFASEARLRCSTFTLCVSECEKQAQVKMSFFAGEMREVTPPPRMRSDREPSVAGGQALGQGRQNKVWRDAAAAKQTVLEGGWGGVTPWECFYTCTLVWMMWKRCDAFFSPQKNFVSGVV